jgi:DNA polymerase-3 subunit delta
MPGLSSLQTVLGEARGGRSAPVVLLLGDDEAGKAPMLEALESVVDPELRAFNVQRFHATDSGFDLADVIAGAQTLPFLGGRRVVLVLRAEVVLKPKSRGGAQAESEAEGAGDALAPASEEATPALGVLEDYLRAPSPDSVLVLVATDLHRGSRIGRLLMQHATVVEFWGLKGDRAPTRQHEFERAVGQALRYVRQRVREAGIAIEEDAVERILAHAGTDLATLRGDLERVLTYCAGRSRITEADVRAVVGGAVAHDDWAVIRAIEAGDARAALRQLHLLFDAGASPYQVLGQVGWFVRTALPQLRRRAPSVASAVRSVFETDLALKTSRGDPQILLERLVVELCGGVENRPAPGAAFRRRPTAR